MMKCRRIGSVDRARLASVLRATLLLLVGGTLTTTPATALPTDSAARTPPAASGDGGVPLDMERLSKLGITTEQLLEHIKHLAQGNHMCGVRDVPGMRRHYLRNRTVTCNDGTPAGYFMRKSHGSSRWLVFLEGGWHCFDEPSCRNRWQNTPHMMSSSRWPEWRKGTGILSWNPEENPFAYNANLVYVPYCSSDTWSGSFKKVSSDDMFSFMGTLIIESVIRDLVELHGMSTAKKMYLAGSSAGATGVLLNLDGTAALLARLAPAVEVRGIADSGWFLDNKQYRPVRCSAPHSCAPTEGIARGVRLWRGIVPDACSKRYPINEKWKCYFGYRIYPTLKTPVFVVQYLFDKAQITVDNVGPPIKKEQWQYIHNVGLDMKHTLLNVSAVFAPACLSHIVLTRSQWHQISVNGVTLSDALKCWEDGVQEDNLYEKHRGRKAFELLAHTLLTGADSTLGDDPRKIRHRKKFHRNKLRRKRQRQKRKRRKKKKKGKKRRAKRRRNRQRGGQPGRAAKPTASTAAPKVFEERRRRRELLVFDLHDFHHMQYHDNQCNHHRVDHCAWPQCNFSCPKIRNPFTGKQMDFVDLLMQFGLDLSSIANALGMDLLTLQTMDHDSLLSMMVQQ